MARNRVIGINNRLPWRVPEDLLRFKALTMGHVLVMGRKTFQSIGRPLPGRKTIVVTRQRDLKLEGVEIAHSVDDALALAGTAQVFIVGGGDLYRQTIGRAGRLYVTVIDCDFEGDAWFPEIDVTCWRLAERESHEGNPRFEFQVWDKISGG